MNATIEVKLKPFDVPNLVYGSYSYKTTPQTPPSAAPVLGDNLLIPLGALSAEDLFGLCREFETAVFKKAKKSAELFPEAKSSAGNSGEKTPSEEIQYLGLMLTATMAEDKDRLWSIITRLIELADYDFETAIREN